MAHTRNIVLAIVFAVLGYGFANLGDAALKALNGKFSFFQILFTNGISCIIFMALYGWYQEGKKAFRTKKPLLQFIRAALGPCSAVFTVTALPHVPLTTYYSLVFTSPFWVVLLSAFFLGDALPTRRLMAVIFGFSVVVWTFAPWNGHFDIWSLAVLIGAFVYSAQMVLVRHLGPSESKSFMGMNGSALSILIGLPFYLMGEFIMPNTFEWLMYLTMGLTGTISFFCVIYAYQVAPAISIVAPYHYTQIVWGALLGYFFFAEVPEMRIIIGATLIILSGIYLVFDETRRSRKLPPETPLTPGI